MTVVAAQCGVEKHHPEWSNVSEFFLTIIIPMLLYHSVALKYSVLGLNYSTSRDTVP